MYKMKWKRQAGQSSWVLWAIVQSLSEPKSGRSYWMGEKGLIYVLERSFITSWTIFCWGQKRRFVCLFFSRKVLILVSTALLFCILAGSWSNIEKGLTSVSLHLYCSAAKSCPTLCSPMDYSTPGFPVLHYLPEFAQVHIHWVSDAIQPSHPLLPSSFAFDLSQHQGLKAFDAF